MSLYNSIAEIYRHLQDEESKFIFTHRIMFSLTHSEEYMHEIVQKIPERHLLENDKDKAYIFGCGFYGKLVYEHMKKNWVSFVDNNPRGDYCGLEVILPEQLPKDACVYLAVKYYADEIEHQLLDLGISKENIINVGKVLMKLGDKQYFDLPALPHKSNEVFVDAGCLNGISSINFIRWACDVYDHIYCFEADPVNADVCKENMHNLIKDGRVTIFDKALSNKNETVSFVSKENGTSCVGDGDEIVEAVTLDSVLSDKRVTFIKMDIEGAEYNALEGAKKIISEQRPKLAISVYHLASDVYDIPNLLLSYCPDYKFYLRHYSLFDEETILYAI